MSISELNELIEETEKQLVICSPESSRYLDLMALRDTLRTSLIAKYEAVIAEYNEAA